MKFFIIFISCLVFFIMPAAAKEKSAYDRVIATQTLRCGYGVFPPMVLKDPNSGKLSGIFVDIMQEIGKAADLKVEFVEEVDWGQISQALRSGRIDAMCAGMWGTAKRGKVMGFSKPLFYSVAKAYARENDRRFDNKLEAMNQPSVRLSVNDGDVSLEIADRWFPKAEKIFKTQMIGEDFVFMNVATGKADVAFTAPSTAKNYIKNNPGSLREVPLPKPLSINQNVIGVDIHEVELLSLLDAAITELQNNDRIQEIFKKYPDVSNDFILQLEGKNK